MTIFTSHFHVRTRCYAVFIDIINLSQQLILMSTIRPGVNFQRFQSKTDVTTPIEKTLVQRSHNAFRHNPYSISRENLNDQFNPGPRIVYKRLRVSATPTSLSSFRDGRCHHSQPVYRRPPYLRKNREATILSKTLVMIGVIKSHYGS